VHRPILVAATDAVKDSPTSVRNDVAHPCVLRADGSRVVEHSRCNGSTCQLRGTPRHRALRSRAFTECLQSRSGDAVGRWLVWIVKQIVDNNVADPDNPVGRSGGGFMPRLLFDIRGSTPDELAMFHRAEVAKWGKIVKDSGARLD
jgi:hypothetical protein